MTSTLPAIVPAPATAGPVQDVLLLPGRGTEYEGKDGGLGYGLADNRAQFNLGCGCSWHRARAQIE